MGTKRIGIMQPYFFPYIGYFHLISAVDVFVIYDNVKYTKRGWINRNRFLEQGAASTFSVPLKKASDSLNIDQREVADSFDRQKLLRRMSQAYRKAPQFDTTFALVRDAVLHSNSNLYDYIENSLRCLLAYLSIEKTILRSSSVEIDHSLRGQDKVIAICSALDATSYVNAIGGTELYDTDHFQDHAIELRFIESHLRVYEQFDQPFVPWLSILDMLMFNPVDVVRADALEGYSLIPKPAAVV
ncbi:WbqC family protein [Roseiconus lacunae]|uniref:WbqC family protein n=1 Tax=Roseiconus lacunae TaxID=2605694 RepID=UPI001E37EB00|nr:WbqC family protein [Roseiconus lacunae]